jgi:hypothetical protein
MYSSTRSYRRHYFGSGRTISWGRHTAGCSETLNAKATLALFCLPCASRRKNGRGARWCGAHKDGFLYPRTRFSSRHSSKHTSRTQKMHFLVEVHRCRISHSGGWDITPCSPLKVNRHFRGTYRLHLQGRRVSQAKIKHLAFALESCSSTLKMEEICSSETLAGFQRTTRRYIPEDNTLQVYMYFTPKIKKASNMEVLSLNSWRSTGWKIVYTWRTIGDVPQKKFSSSSKWPSAHVPRCL